MTVVVAAQCYPQPRWTSSFQPFSPITSFGEDADGEVHIVGYDGTIT